MTKFASILALTALFACNGLPDADPGPDAPAEAWGPQTEEHTVFLDGEDPTQAQIDAEKLMAEMLPLAAGLPENMALDMPGFGDPVVVSEGQTDKSTSITALQGYAIRGHMQFQNGVQQSPETVPDACTTFGKTCDSVWHIQANDTFMDGPLDFFGTQAQGGDFLGACGSNADQNEYMPCIQRYASQSVGGHNFTWMLNDAQCGDATAKANVRAGIIQGLARISGATNPGTGITFTEALPPSTTANYLFECGVAAPGSSNVLGWWHPLGNLTLRFGGPLVDGLPATFTDTCETTGLPGGTPTLRVPAIETWRPDFQYTYSTGRIVIEDQILLPLMATCTTDVNKIRRGIATVVTHELGHDWGFQHTSNYTDVNFSIMRDSLSCTQLRDFVLTPHPYLRYAMADQDMSSAAVGSNTIWDNDFSCFQTSGFGQSTPNPYGIPQP